MQWEKSFQNFSNKVTDILDKHVPITKLGLKKMKSSNKSWLIKGINQNILSIGNLLEPKISIPKTFTTKNLKDPKA